jgi:hypothetical protein
MNLRALNDACHTAADGTVLGIAEVLAVKQWREGRSIGSGLIEGACLNLIGRRLKQTAARRRVRRLYRRAGLCAIMCGKPWNDDWHHQSA